MTMTFGEWVRRNRQRRGLTVEALADMSGVAQATVSRVENRHNRTTLGIAIRICDAFGVKPVQLANELAGEKHAQGDNQPEDAVGHYHVATLEDVATFVRLYQEDPESAADLLAHCLNVAISAARAKYGFELSPNNITSSQVRLFADEAYLYTADLVYRLMPQELVVAAARSEGAIMSVEVMIYLSDAHYRIRVEQEEEQQHVNTMYNKINLTDKANLKLGDILALDQEMSKRPLGNLTVRTGDLLSMLWSATKFQERFGHSVPAFPKMPELDALLPKTSGTGYKPASTFVVTCRWLQQLFQQDRPWLDELRRDMALYRAEPPESEQ